MLVLLPVLTQAANIDAWVDRNPVAANESLQLTIEADGDPDGDPDFGPLKQDFDILSHATGSNVQIINGNVKRSVQWQLGLMPKRAGDLTIPAIRFGRDSSPRIAVKVTQATATDPASADVFIEAEAAPLNPYVQQQVIYTLRVYRAVDTANATLSAPEFPGGEALIEKLGDDIDRDERRDGRRFRVTERRYAIYPQHSGRLDIPAVRFAGQVLQTRRNVWDPFGGSYSPRQVRSRALQLDVKPIPSSYTGQHWLPATEVRLAQAWAETPPRFQAGEPGTHTLAIIADGLTAAQLPDVSLPLPPGAKGYPDQPELRDERSATGIAGLRQQKLAVIPQTEGTIDFPEITLTWWNTTTDAQETARLPAQSFPVAPGLAPPPAPPVQAAPLSATPPQPAADPAPLPARAPASPVFDRLGALLDAGIWPWISLALALGWLLTLLLWWRAAHRKPVAETPPAPAPRKPGLNALRQACDANDAAGAKDALLDWTAAHWPSPTPTNLEGIRQRLPTHSALAEAIAELNHALYSPRKQAWSGNVLKSTLAELELKPVRKDDSRDDLEPLYR
ncbi:MAG: protein BatD [Gammaproteobacteria bacterium]|nr:protein BatD [Gammaproteobacteria bacterium]